MNEIKVRSKFGKLLIVLFISIIVFLIIYYLYYMADIRLLRGFESNSVNWRFMTKAWLEQRVFSIPKTEIYKRIVIAAIDDETIDKYGGTFPFDRKVWAEILNHFNSLPEDERPFIIFFDIVFTEPSQDKESDKKLLDAYKNYKEKLGEDIILEGIVGQNIMEIGGEEENISEARKYFLEKECKELNDEKIKALKKFEIRHFELPENCRVRTFPKISPLMEGLAQYVDFLGTANVSEEENTYKFLPLIARVIYKVKNNGDYSFTNIYYPSVVLSMVLTYLKSDISNISIEKGKIVIKDALYNNIKTNFSIPVDNLFQLTINYKSWPGSRYMQKIPLKDLTRAKLPKNPIIFVGMYSKKGSHDIKLSPLGDMYGVEHLAYAFGTIINRDFIKTIPEWINIFYLCLFTVLAGLLVSGGSRLIPFASLFSIIFPLLLGIILFFFNYKIIMIMPLISSLLAIISVQIYRLFTEEKDKRFIKATFSSYLNPKLVDILIQNPAKVKLGGEDKEITVFFSAIENLEEITEKMDPGKMVEFINSYFSSMADIIMENSGTLDKYIGNSIMAFWGAPIDIPDHALKACETAVKMLEETYSFNNSLIEKGIKPIELHIGINTGNIIVGNVGSEQQKNYTVIGDAVNLASRLKGANKFYHTEIIISEFTYSKVKEKVITRELDLTRVKGKLKPVRIFELLDMKQ